jgi:hypothetical protein
MKLYDQTQKFENRREFSNIYHTDTDFIISEHKKNYLCRYKPMKFTTNPSGYSCILCYSS